MKTTQTLRYVPKTASLYIHWPYCKRRCTYCNFNKYIERNVNEKRMRDCLVRETETLINLSGITGVSSIFFGGGTPSLASADTIASVIRTVESLVHFPQSAEVSLEANPTALETSQLRDFRDAGVNRISLGIQTLKAEDLKVLGRDHTVKESLKSISEARDLFPGRVSVDLIFGRPGQTVHAWMSELKQMLFVCDHHISLYQLTLERGTQLFKSVTRGQLRLPSPDDVASMYKMAVQILADNDFERYEVSNFAKEGAHSQHNMSYWLGRDYIGVGPGAHGRFHVDDVRQARIQTLEPDVWMKEVEVRGHATRKVVRQTVHDQLEELLAVGLRTRDGVDIGQWRELSPDTDLLGVFTQSSRVQALIEQGLLHQDHRGIRATDKGLDVLDSILPVLIHHLLELASSTDVT